MPGGVGKGILQFMVGPPRPRQVWRPGVGIGTAIQGIGKGFGVQRDLCQADLQTEVASVRIHNAGQALPLNAAHGGLELYLEKVSRAMCRM